MANTSVFITAGLPVAKDSGQSPTGTSVFITAGLPKAVEEAPAANAPTGVFSGSLVGPFGGPT